MTRKEFLALPKRLPDVKSEYDDIYIVPTYRVHESGYRIMAVVGANKDGSKEIAATGDVIWWQFLAHGRPILHSDMDTNNIQHFWCCGCKLRVGYNYCSTVDIDVVNEGEE